MKKLVLVVGIMMMVLTGCGNKTEANVIETEMAKEAVGNVIKDVVYTDPELWFEIDRSLSVKGFEELCELGYYDEDCKNDLVEITKSVVYDPNYISGFDQRQFEYDMVNCLTYHNVIPGDCYGQDLDYVFDNGYLDIFS